MLAGTGQHRQPMQPLMVSIPTPILRIFFSSRIPPSDTRVSSNAGTNVRVRSTCTRCHVVRRCVCNVWFGRMESSHSVCVGHVQAFLSATSARFALFPRLAVRFCDVGPLFPLVDGSFGIVGVVPSSSTWHTHNGFLSSSALHPSESPSSSVSRSIAINGEVSGGKPKPSIVGRW